MKVQQQALPFRPITITFEKQGEAAALFSLMKKVQNDTQLLELSGQEESIVTQILDAKIHI